MIDKNWEKIDIIKTKQPMVPNNKLKLVARLKFLKKDVPKTDGPYIKDLILIIQIKGKVFNS